MNFRLITLPLASLALINPTLPVNAQTRNHRPPPPEVSIEVNASNYKYEEPDFMQLEGRKIAIAGRITQRNNNSMAVIEGRLSNGKVDYTSVGTGSSPDEPDFYTEIRGLVGITFSSNRAISSLYLGLGWRRLVNDSSGTTTSTGDTGYKRISNYLYIPIGIESKQIISGNNYIEFNAEYDYFWRGTQQSEISGVTITNYQSRGRGFRASMLLGINRFAIGPYFNRWEIGDSSVEQALGTWWIEPANNTTEAGIRLRYSFK